MQFVIFILGMLTGIILLGLSVIIVISRKSDIEREIRNVEKSFKQKAKILSTSPSDLEAWTNELKS